VKYLKKIAVNLDELRKATKALLKREKLIRGGVTIDPQDLFLPTAEISIFRRPKMNARNVKNIIEIGPVTLQRELSTKGKTTTGKVIIAQGGMAALSSRIAKATNVPKLAIKDLSGPSQEAFNRLMLLHEGFEGKALDRLMIKYKEQLKRRP
jgi:hypothetical protein